MESLEFDTVQRDRSVNGAPTTAIERPRNAANTAREWVKDIEVWQTFDATRALRDNMKKLLTRVVGNGTTGKSRL
jgi:hypothetical protein